MKTQNLGYEIVDGILIFGQSNKKKLSLIYNQPECMVSTYIEWRCSKSPDDIFKMMCYLFEKVNSLPWKKDIADPKLQNFKIDKAKC